MGEVPWGAEREAELIVDCDRCQMRDIACDNCVITALIGIGADGVELDESERRALDALADVGMVPRLRLSLPEERAS